MSTMCFSSVLLGALRSEAGCPRFRCFNHLGLGAGSPSFAPMTRLLQLNSLQGRFTIGAETQESSTRLAAMQWSMPGRMGSLGPDLPMFPQSFLGGAYPRSSRAVSRACNPTGSAGEDIRSVDLAASVAHPRGRSAMVIMFRRKDSKLSTNDEKDDRESFVSTSSTRTSNASMKVPMTIKTVNGGSVTIPEVPVAPPPDPNLDPAAYLRSIHSVRQRSRAVMKKAKRNQLNHFDIDFSKFADTAQYVASIIKRDYAPDYHAIPAHSRWHHFDVGGRPRINQLLQSWPSTIDTFERTRRLIDLFLISVLLDAGSGSKWSYKSKESGRIYRRSEGLAVASLEMFKTGLFSSDPTEPCQVDGAGLKKVTVGQLAKGMQHSENNPLPGLEGRAGLLIRLSEALNNQEFFGVDARPGNMLDYLLSHHTTLASSVPIISIPTLWSVLMDGLSSIWPPSRTQVDGVSIGDAWHCSLLASPPASKSWESIVPFHKLTQWLCYSLMAPMTKVMKIQFSGTGLLTGLPEYRNGGLLIDMGLLNLKREDAERGIQAYKSNSMIKGQPNVEVVPLFTVDDGVIVEWRALTVGFLDELLEEVNNLLGLPSAERLTLAQMLEAGTWKGGREIAEVSRPNTKEAPIMILSDGTVF
ncbi:conserved hypothetical protein [Histoplasma capsulatum var. duboisii H88]|uniref:DUF1688 domain-containing protein n=1 Tax=Ajellomyces capsulatus (strain H88) TaxID=544711 RepID=F0ULI1_AJEC8|nr:conserved hypothetical protein [Histoplasma capsulatum var. duboisii H88]